MVTYYNPVNLQMEPTREHGVWEFALRLSADR